EEKDRSAETGVNASDLQEERPRTSHAFQSLPVQDDRSSTFQDQDRCSADDSERTYHLRDRSYVLRESEFATLTEIGKLRVIDSSDLVQFAYGNDDALMARDLHRLEQQGLLVRRPLGPESKQSRRLVTLTKKGKRLLVASGRIPEGQALYHGVVKPREL